MTGTAGTGTAVPRDFAVLLPPGWARIPIDGRENAQAAALAAQKTAGLTEPQRGQAREKLTRLIRSALRDARSCGGIDMEPLADAFVLLFDAIARSLRWRS